MAVGDKKLVLLEAKDGKLDEPMEARLLLPSDLLKSMLPEDRECFACFFVRVWGGGGKGGFGVWCVELGEGGRGQSFFGGGGGCWEGAVVRSRQAMQIYIERECVCVGLTDRPTLFLPHTRANGTRAVSLPLSPPLSLPSHTLTPTHTRTRSTERLTPSPLPHSSLPFPSITHAHTRYRNERGEQ
jgi:hypothetical protein